MFGNPLLATSRCDNENGTLRHSKKPSFGTFLPQPDAKGTSAQKLLLAKG